MRKADKERAKEQRAKEKVAIKREKEEKASAARMILLPFFEINADNQDPGRTVLDQDLRLLHRPILPTGV